MNWLFWNIWHVSVSVTPVILLLLPLLSRIGKQYAPGARCCIWAVVSIRLLVPFNVSLRGVLHSVTPLEQADRLRTPLALPLAQDGLAATGAVLEQAAPGTGAVSYLSLFTGIWLVGMTASLVYHIAAHFMVCKRLHRWGIPVTDPAVCRSFEEGKRKLSINRDIGLFMTSQTKTPLLIGCFSPRVYIPDHKADDAELAVVFTHELCHFKRRDLWFKGMLLLVRAVHWFNPAVRYLLHRVELDIEIACDHDALSGATGADRKYYAQTILSFFQQAEKIPSPLTTNFFGGQKQMKQRFASILRQNNMRSGIALVALCILVVVLCGAWTTNRTPSTSDVERYANMNDWAFATRTLRSEGHSEAFVEADRLFCVKSVNGNRLTVQYVYRSVDESGAPLPEIMFSDEDDPVLHMAIDRDTVMQTLYTEPFSTETEIGGGAPSDIVAGDIISFWGDFDEQANAYAARRIAIWRIKNMETSCVNRYLPRPGGDGDEVYEVVFDFPNPDGDPFSLKFPVDGVTSMLAMEMDVQHMLQFYRDSHLYDIPEQFSYDVQVVADPETAAKFRE